MLAEPAALETLLEAGPSPADAELADEDEETGAPGAPSGAVLMSEAETAELFAALFAQYEQPIFQYAYRMLGDAEDARDFTQDAFVKAYRKLPETVAKGNFQAQAWLYRIATNVCLDELRHRRLLKWQAWDSFVSLFHPSQIARDNPERDAMQSETKGEVGQVLDRLSPRYRAALVMREYHGLGYEEIAEVLGTSRTAVKTLLLRARESFRLHYARMHPALAAQARGPRVLPRVMGRTSAGAEAKGLPAHA